jgi:hypothetical protein
LRFFLCFLYTMRKIFTDKYNSLKHFVFGVLSYYYQFIIPLFLLYQSLESYYIVYNNKKDENIIIDVTEFIIGYFVIFAMTSLTK